MAADPIEGTAPVERRPAVWPWILMPLVALAIFYALLRLREANAPLSAPALPVASETIPSE
jgi:hypothetical protein